MRSTLEEINAIITYAETNGYYSVNKKFGGTMPVSVIEKIKAIKENAKTNRGKNTGKKNRVKHRTVLTNDDVCKILKMRISGDLCRQIHEKFPNVSKGHIENICRGTKRIDTDEQKTLFETLSKLNVDGRFSDKKTTIKKINPKSNISNVEIQYRIIEGLKTTKYE